MADHHCCLSYAQPKRQLSNLPSFGEEAASVPGSPAVVMTHTGSRDDPEVWRPPTPVWPADNYADSPQPYSVSHARPNVLGQARKSQCRTEMLRPGPKFPASELDHHLGKVGLSSESQMEGCSRWCGSK